MPPLAGQRFLQAPPEAGAGNLQTGVLNMEKS
jgi:hypothetical protein